MVPSGSCQEYVCYRPALSEPSREPASARQVDGVTRTGLSHHSKVRTVRTVRKVRTVLLVPVPVLLLAAFIAGCGGSSEPDRLNIAVIPKGTSHAFWQSVHAGARRAAKELDVDITWRGPLREDDRESQVAEVENAVARRVSGIALAPLDEAALVAPVMSARRSGVPVVIFDSGLKGGEFVSFVATDNDKGGELAGDHLGKALGGSGKAILLRYAEGHDSTTRREEGFLRGLKAHPQIEIV